MKIIILSGSHPRHLYVHRALLELGIECAVVVMQRESLLPTVPNQAGLHDRQLFERHFQDRFNVEANIYGQPTPQEIFKSIPSCYCSPDSLNSPEVTEFVQNFNADLAFIFGTDLIKEPLLSALPKDKINLHLGLSPWYRGSATLFWPFYFLQPQFTGATFHQIVPEADAGGILHQTIPELHHGDGIHDVGARTVIRARQDLIKLIEIFQDTGGFSYQQQKSSGRLFLTRDFHYSHLRLIYDLYGNRIVDEYLTGSLSQLAPKIIHAI
jgi:hypothetical protein